MGVAVQLTVYQRHGCHLCSDMLLSLEALRVELGFHLQTVDIDADTVLQQRYNSRVPVLAAGDIEICYYFLDEPLLRAHLAENEP